MKNLFITGITLTWLSVGPNLCSDALAAGGGGDEIPCKTYIANLGLGGTEHYPFLPNNNPNGPTNGYWNTSYGVQEQGIYGWYLQVFYSPPLDDAYAAAVEYEAEYDASNPPCQPDGPR